MKFNKNISSLDILSSGSIGYTVTINTTPVLIISATKEVKKLWINNAAILSTGIIYIGTNNSITVNSAFAINPNISPIKFYLDIDTELWAVASSLQYLSILELGSLYD